MTLYDQISDTGVKVRVRVRVRVRAMVRVRVRVRVRIRVAECAHLIDKARSWLHPSRVVNHASSGDTYRLSTARTSSSCKVAAKGLTL